MMDKSRNEAPGTAPVNLSHFDDTFNFRRDCKVHVQQACIYLNSSFAR